MLDQCKACSKLHVSLIHPLGASGFGGDRGLSSAAGFGPLRTRSHLPVRARSFAALLLARRPGPCQCRRSSIGLILLLPRSAAHSVSSSVPPPRTLPSSFVAIAPGCRPQLSSAGISQASARSLCTINTCAWSFATRSTRSRASSSTPMMKTWWTHLCPVLSLPASVSSVGHVILEAVPFPCLLHFACTPPRPTHPSRRDHSAFPGPGQSEQEGPPGKLPPVVRDVLGDGRGGPDTLIRSLDTWGTAVRSRDAVRTHARSKTCCKPKVQF